MELTPDAISRIANDLGVVDPVVQDNKAKYAEQPLQRFSLIRLINARSRTVEGKLTIISQSYEIVQLVHNGVIGSPKPYKPEGSDRSPSADVKPPAPQTSPQTTSPIPQPTPSPIKQEPPQNPPPPVYQQPQPQPPQPPVPQPQPQYQPQLPQYQQQQPPTSALAPPPPPPPPTYQQDLRGQQPSYQSYQPQPPSKDPLQVQPPIPVPQTHLLQQSTKYTQAQLEDFYHEYSQLPGAERGMIELLPIDSLTAFSPPHWCIRARVTKRTEVKTFRRQTPMRSPRAGMMSDDPGEGKLFSCNLLDVHGNETRLVFWTEYVDRFDPLIKTGEIYFIARTKIQEPSGKNRQWCPFQYELIAQQDTIIIPADALTEVARIAAETGSTNVHIDPSLLAGNGTKGDASTAGGVIEMIHWDFVGSIDQLSQAIAQRNLDVCGVVCETSDAQSFTSRAQARTMRKKSIMICDPSRKYVEVTFWSDQCDAPDLVSLRVGDVISLKSVRLGEFRGVNLSYSFNSQRAINDFSHEVPARLKQWWDQEGKALYDEHLRVDNESTPNPIFDRVYGKGGKAAALQGRTQFANLPRVTVYHIQESDAGTVPARDDYFSIVGLSTIIMQNNMTYAACPVDNCGKKLTPTGCPEHGNLGEELQKEPLIKYLINMSFSDFTGSLFVTLFTNTAQILMGKSAAELKALKEEQEDAFELHISSRRFCRYVWRIRARADTYNDLPSKRLTCVGLDPVDYPRESVTLLSNIMSYMSEDDKRRYGIALPAMPAPQVSGAPQTRSVQTSDPLSQQNQQQQQYQTPQPYQQQPYQQPPQPYQQGQQFIQGPQYQHSPQWQSGPQMPPT